MVNMPMLKSCYGLKATQKEEMIAAMKGAAKAINSGDLKISHINKELVIGNLGATIIKIESKSGDVDYDPVIYVRDGSSWYIIPYADEKGLRDFAASRTEDEQVHLKLFERWVYLMQKRLEKK